MNSDVFEAFQLIARHINTEIMHNLEVFAAKVCNKITLQGSNPSELLWDIYFENLKKNESGNVKNRKKKSKFSENLTNL